ncbi:Hypothetical protein Nlim_0601 [Candidatus Nitrosarchaeum limnium SFB1]|uniref:Uncharacterized protein n=1 Tax=Candidatus Nitrosarchaeum limnium SFB1 TaxID=886738 RepID=F3KJE3_9ARCH|nr:Hypothetical protein Nlim_0601 [Candidatus Nitrosarchaeum limnium SFB1]
MTYHCNGICVYHKTNKISTSKKYESGQKRCSLCSIFIETTNIRCPCCHSLLRRKSRSNKKLRSMEIFE